MTIAPIDKKASKTKIDTGCISTDNLLKEILSKKPKDRDESDIRSLQYEIFTTRNPVLNAVVQQYYDYLYGSEAAPKDEFGKYYTIEPTDEKKAKALNFFFDTLHEVLGIPNSKDDDKKKKDKENEEDRELDEEFFARDEPSQEEKFIWKGNGCEACAEYDGQEFTLAEVPGTHPNCKCDLVSTQNPQKVINPKFDYEKYHREKAEKQKEDERLLEQMKENLKEEGSETHPYLDTEGFITTGVGANINTREAFMNTDWKVDGRPATDDEKAEAFRVMQEAKRNGEYGQEITAKYYESKTNIRIDVQKAERMRDEHLQKDLKEIKKEVPGFDNLPFELKEVLMDIRYNAGNVKEPRWPKLHEGIREKDIQKIAKNVNRKGIGKKRNDWARDRILSIKKW